MIMINLMFNIDKSEGGTTVSKGKGNPTFDLEMLGKEEAPT